METEKLKIFLPIVLLIVILKLSQMNCLQKYVVNVTVKKMIACMERLLFSSGVQQDSRGTMQVV